MIEYVDVISVQKVSHLNSWFYLISSTLILIMCGGGCSGSKSIALKLFIHTEKHLITSSFFSFVTLCASAKFSFIHCGLFELILWLALEPASGPE